MGVSACVGVCIVIYAVNFSNIYHYNSRMYPRYWKISMYSENCSMEQKK